MDEEVKYNSPTHVGGTTLRAKQKYSEKQTIEESKKIVPELQ